MDEKPLALFKDLDREGKKPMFMLRRLASASEAGAGTGGLKTPGSGGGGFGGVGGAMSSASSVRTMGGIGAGVNLPGGVL